MLRGVGVGGGMTGRMILEEERDVHDGDAVTGVSSGGFEESGGEACDGVLFDGCAL